MSDREFELARKIESVLAPTSLLNMHERTATIVYHLIEYKDLIEEIQRETCASGLSLVAFNSPQGRIVYMDDAVKMCLTSVRK